MHNILCFGDSNTWGYMPNSGERFNEDTRWPALAQSMLGNEYKIHEAGLNGRTIQTDQTDKPFRNGSQYLGLYLESCRPLDLVIIMLGTNDLKNTFALSIDDIKAGASALCKQVLNFDYGSYKAPQVLLVAPAPLVESVELGDEFSGTLLNSKRLAPAYYQLCQDHKIHFLDAGRVVKVSSEDGVHWNREGHEHFAQHLAALLPSLLGC